MSEHNLKYNQKEGNKTDPVLMNESAIPWLD
jgi:hypothetical protein